MRSPRGNARATYLSRGISLPPRGTVGERVMFEMLKRERWNKTSEWEISIRAVANILGTGGEGVNQMIGTLKKTLDSKLSHEYYDASTIVTQLKEKLGELYKNKRLLRRLDSM